MLTTLLASNDVRLIAQRFGLDPLMDAMIDRLGQCLQSYDANQIDVKIRDGFAYSSPALGLIEWMPVLEPGRATIKIVGYHPRNPAVRGIPTILSTVAVFDPVTGHLTGLVDGTFLTALRTGAASAVASRILASPRSRALGLIGAGAQAVTQLHGMVRVLQSLETVYVYDLVLDRSRSFLERVSPLLPPGVSIHLSTPDELLPKVDVLCTQTSVEPGDGPVFEDGPHKGHLHVNAIGSDFPGKIELPLPLLERGIVCPDFPEQASREGECQQLTRQQIGPSLAALVKDPDRYRFAHEGPTVFDSTGFALEDAVAAQLLLDLAAEMGVGSSLELESVSEDPWNPYAFYREPAGSLESAASDTPFRV